MSRICMQMFRICERVKRELKHRARQSINRAGEFNILHPSDYWHVCLYPRARRIGNRAKYYTVKVG